MILPVTAFNDRIWADIEDRLSPLPEGSKNWKIIHVMPLVVELPIGALTNCLQAVNKILAYLASFSPWPHFPDPRQDFSSMLADSRQWKRLGDVEEKVTLGHNNPQFLFGTATCTLQDSFYQCPDSQWNGWAKKKVSQDNLPKEGGGLFRLYQSEVGRRQITDSLHQLGVNSYRFSIEWSQIQPREGEWNEENLQVYVDFCKHLRNEGITPMVTLHHFSEPLWFHEKGSFEKEENIDAFLFFAEKVFTALTVNYRGSPLVDHFCTINEPAVEAFSRFVRGAFSPGLFLNFRRAAQFLKGALKAHCIVYEKLKAKAPDVQIGIVHQYLKMIPTNPLLFPVVHYLNRLVNNVSLEFFRTGTFSFKMPFVCNVTGEMPTPKTDFVGVQYYARPLIGLTGSTSYYEPMTQMPMREDPEGLYEAIIETHKAYRAPVIVTENGISTHDDAQRARYLPRALYAAQRAQEVIGQENLLGYYLWCFSDNFEWDMGMKPQAFGAFTLEGTLKEGSQAFARTLKSWRASWADRDDRIAC